jgi:membrane dipeptidase
VGIGSDIDLSGYDAMRPGKSKRLRDSYKGSFSFREKIKGSTIRSADAGFNATSSSVRTRESPGLCEPRRSGRSIRLPP